jgi:putative addiction module killer protein
MCGGATASTCGWRTSSTTSTRCSSVGAGVWEARLAFGPGYRIYFGKEGDSIIILLIGGTKTSQGRDIRRAQEFWRGYLEAKRHGKTK